MKDFTAFLCLFMITCWAVASPAGSQSTANPQVVVKTTLGDFQLMLDAEKAPVTVANFLAYVDEDGFSDTIFHRVIEGFMVQGGGLRANMREVKENDEIRNEADNGLLNVSGTIAMARTQDIDSASRQFFINVNDNTSLDHTEASCTREDEKKQKRAAAKGLFRPVSCKSFGYAVFGRVIKGMEIVRRIEYLQTVSRGGYEDVPEEPVLIIRVERL
jgi:cyclophilin family peptidyl-prolyl cis-trans isomerase